MNQLERNISILKRYLPEPAAPLLAGWIIEYDFKLKIKRSRQSKYGDYRQPIRGSNHQITINHDLNPYAFLLTLVHEVAHLLCFERHGNTVKPHGEEWKQAFRELMRPVMQLHVFPDDVRNAIIRYMQNPAATSCSDMHLMRVLRKYDTGKTKVIHLEELPFDALFLYNGRLFRKGAKRRTRFLCLELDTRRPYLFSPLAEVEAEQPAVQSNLSETKDLPIRAVANAIPPPKLVAEAEINTIPAATIASELPKLNYSLSTSTTALAALAENALFGLGNKIYRKGEQQHTYFLCIEIKTQTIIRFSPAVQVRRVE